MLILDKQVSVLMMKKDNNGRYLSKLNKKATSVLTEAFGGATIESTSGTWLNGSKLYTDRSYKVTCNYAKKLTDKQLKALLTVIRMEFLQGGQQAVSVVSNGTLYILERSDLNKLENIFLKKL